MDTTSVSVQYRPIRIGWCVRKNNFEDCNKAIRLNHTLWGGCFNPLIVIDDFEHAKLLIEFFMIDILIPVFNDATVTEFIKKFDYLDSWDISNDSIFLTSPKQAGKIPKFLDIFSAALAMSENSKYKDYVVNDIQWSENDPLNKIFLFMFGKIPSSNEIDTEFDYLSLISSCINAHNINIEENEILPESLLDGIPLNCLSGYMLEQNTQEFWRRSGVYIGKYDSYDDLINFWNLKCSGVRLIYIDLDYMDRLENFLKTYLKGLSIFSESNLYPDGSIAIWTNKIENFDKSIFGENPIICQIDPTIWNGYNIKKNHWYFNEKVVLGILSKGKNKYISFDLPNKIFGQGISFYQYFITSIKVLSDFENLFSMNLPFIPELNKYFSKKLDIHEHVRIEQGRIGIITSKHDHNISLKFMSAHEIISGLFKFAGMNISSSDAGNKFNNLLKNMESIQNCRVFKIKGVRDFLNKFKRGKAFTKSMAKEIFFKDMNGNYKDLYLDGKIANSEKVFSYLSSKNIFRLGIELTCKECRLVSWKLIDNVKSITKCDMCDFKFKIINQIKDNVPWKYKISGILNQDEKGGIPVAITLCQLQFNTSYRNFIFESASNINFVDKKIAKNPCETDFIILTTDTNGKPTIVISECKSRLFIKQEDVKNLSRVANLLDSKGIETYILFSKLSNFNEDEIENCKKARSEYFERVIMLTDRELTPLHMYEKTKLDFRIEENASTFEVMASNTSRIYFGKSN